MIRRSIALAAACLLIPQQASAAVALFNFTEADASAGLGSGPYASVTVTENGGSLDFLMTLLSGYRIHDGNANHNAFTFSLLGDPSVTISNLTAGFTAVNPLAGDTVDAPPFGVFFTGLDCGSTACGPGYGGGFAGPLSFTVSAASSLSLSSLGFNTVGGKNIYFTTDIVQENGNTGNVGATLIRGGGTPGPVPEPATWAMMLVGFGAVGYAMRHRKVRPTLTYNFA